MQVLCSDGEVRVVDDAQVQQLLAEARRLQLDPADLDDVVHDCCDRAASRRVNHDTDLPEDIEAAQDIAYAQTSLRGSSVNNGGLDAQVPFLLAELGYADTLTGLRAAAGPLAG